MWLPSSVTDSMPHALGMIVVGWPFKMCIRDRGLMAKVRDAPGIQLCYEPDYANADVAIRSHLASGALLEVSEDGDHGIDFCLALCAWLREVTPDCRLMLMCPEGQPEAVSRAIEAKRRGEIDDFVFYDVSLDYLAASLQSL